MVMYILTFTFLTGDEKTEGSGLNGSKNYQALRYKSEVLGLHIRRGIEFQ
jgi:hypothetical protein